MAVGPPPPHVLRAFGVGAAARPLPGGQGLSWVAGGLVLKPEAGPVYEWLAGLLAEVVVDGVRVASPVCTSEGAWLCGGWSATRWVEGREPERPSTSTWIAVVEAGRALHRALADVPRPDCLDRRTHRWALGDRVAWGERDARFGPELAELAQRLRGAPEPSGSPQVVHGDLTRNVLFAPGVDPAVIDFSPYWRPPEYAEGIVLADALCWHGAPVTLLELADVSVAAVARALLFRMATSNELATSRPGGGDLQGEARRYSLAAAAIGL
jgi:uncharacterized protein (TIGR02569 family)